MPGNCSTSSRKRSSKNHHHHHHRKHHSVKRQKLLQAEESQYWNSSNDIRGCSAAATSTVVVNKNLLLLPPVPLAVNNTTTNNKPRTVGIVEPRVVAVKQLKQHFDSEQKSFMGPEAGSDDKTIRTSATPLKLINSGGSLNIGPNVAGHNITTTCLDSKVASSGKKVATNSNGVRDRTSIWPAATRKHSWDEFSDSNFSGSESPSSSSSSSSSSEEEEVLEQPIKVSKSRRAKKNKNSCLRRKAEALLRLAASKSDDRQNPRRNNPVTTTTMTNFSLKTPDDQWVYCEIRGCTFWTRKPERMDRHQQCHRADTKYYKCPDCSLRFYSLAKMLKHDRKVHTGVKDYECRVCEAEVTDIQIHMRVIIIYYVIEKTSSMASYIHFIIFCSRCIKLKSSLSVQCVPWNLGIKIPWSGTCVSILGNDLTVANVVIRPSYLCID